MCFNFNFKQWDEFGIWTISLQFMLQLLFLVGRWTFTSILLVYYFKRWDKFGLTNVHLHFCFIFHFKQLVKVGLQKFHFKFCFNLDSSKFHLNFCFNLYFELSVEFGLCNVYSNLSTSSFTFAVHSAIIESKFISYYLYYGIILFQSGTITVISSYFNPHHCGPLRYTYRRQFHTKKNYLRKKLCETTLFTWLWCGLMQNCRPWLDPRLW